MENDFYGRGSEGNPVRGINHKTQTIWIGRDDTTVDRIKSVVNFCSKLTELGDTDKLFPLLYGRYTRNAQTPIPTIWLQTAHDIARAHIMETKPGIYVLVSASLDAIPELFDKEENTNPFVRDQGKVDLDDGTTYEVKSGCPAEGFIKGWVKAYRESRELIERSQPDTFRIKLVS